MNVLDKIATAYAAVDGLAEDLATAYRQRINVLLNEQGERDEELWASANAPLDVTLDMLISVPVQQRKVSDEWNQQLAAVIAAVIRQAQLEYHHTKLFVEGMAERYSRRQKVAAKDMTKAELKQAAKDGVSKDAFDGAKKARMERTVAA